MGNTNININTINTKIYDIKLTAQELLFLDNKVSESAQKIINIAKEELSYNFDLPIMNEIIRISLQKGKLSWTGKDIRSCSYCDKSSSYQKHMRNGKYHRKGDINYDKPIYYYGIKFNEGFVTIKGHGDLCIDCLNKYNVINRLIDYIIENDLSIEIQKNSYKESKYLKDNIRICKNCNSEIQESKMGRESTLMGNGTFPSICPLCNSKSSFANNHKITDKFVMINNPAFAEEIKILRDYIKEFNNKVDDKYKVELYQDNNIITHFMIKELTWKNGKHTIIDFNVNSKRYNKDKYWFKYDIHNEFDKILDKYGYVENKKD